ncbi:hypothetical protein CANARDRAFT_113508 [[Candida] arabinofermentans NRRL YB-2248]|uniref:Uncharacterized protein n=1 Tax=[Candida] arabinofermentans NRRL YB-2248 TaxID=983967 RepID=A0A1E4T4H6_9ASCO|nr:hypothetical protein CANARDRAFT_113508 [[Candida] arabinofermentans NRRL YB-2248]
MLFLKSIILSIFLHLVRIQARDIITDDLATLNAIIADKRLHSSEYESLFSENDSIEIVTQFQSELQEMRRYYVSNDDLVSRFYDLVTDAPKFYETGLNSGQQSRVNALLPIVSTVYQNGETKATQTTNTKRAAATKIIQLNQKSPRRGSTTSTTEPSTSEAGLQSYSYKTVTKGGKTRTERFPLRTINAKSTTLVNTGTDEKTTTTSQTKRITRKTRGGNTSQASKIQSKPPAENTSTSSSSSQDTASNTKGINIVSTESVSSKKFPDTTHVEVHTESSSSEGHKNDHSFTGLEHITSTSPSSSSSTLSPSSTSLSSASSSSLPSSSSQNPSSTSSILPASSISQHTPTSTKTLSQASTLSSQTTKFNNVTITYPVTYQTLDYQLPLASALIYDFYQNMDNYTSFVSKENNTAFSSSYSSVIERYATVDPFGLNDNDGQIMAVSYLQEMSDLCFQLPWLDRLVDLAGYLNGVKLINDYYKQVTDTSETTSVSTSSNSSSLVKTMDAIYSLNMDWVNEYSSGDGNEFVTQHYENDKVFTSMSSKYQQHVSM